MATKKISELPLITQLSGSNEGTSVIPVVVGGTTDQISIEDFSKFVNRYNATTSSNTFIGNQTINGNVTATGNGIFGGNVEIAGMVTAQQYNVTYVSSSVQYQSGSTEFGDTADDNHIFTGTILLNGNAIGLGQLNAQTASQALVNIGISSVTGSMNTQSSSQDLVNRRISSTTGSINTTTSSFDSVFLRIGSTTGSMNTQSSSQDLVNRGISSVTGSINTTTSSFDSVFLRISSTTGSMNTQTGSQDLVNFNISKVTASIDAHILKQATQTGSQDLVNFVLSKVTASIDAHILGISTYTASATTINTSIDAHILAQSKQTASQDLVNLGISTYTGSNETWKTGVRSEISAIEAWTSSLDSTYATDAQLYQLYQATASIHFTTSSLNTQTGSQDSVNLRIASTTGSINNTTSSFNTEFGKIGSTTSSIHFTTASLIGITNGLMAFTAALDSTYATDAQLYQLYQATASLNIQTGSQDSVNLGISTATGSLIGITNGIMALTASMKNSTIVSSSNQIPELFRLMQATASLNTTTGSFSAIVNQILQTTASLNSYTGSQSAVVNNIMALTASMKAAAIVSSSTQIQNYNLFAITSSANIFYGTQTITGSLRVSGSITINSGSITMPNRPAFRVVGTASTDRVAQTTLSGSYASIDYNEGNYYNNSTGIFTAPLTGLYNVYYNGRCGNVNSMQQVIVYKNGSTGTVQLMWEAPGNTGVAHFGVSGVFKLVAGDTLEAKVAVGSIQFDGNDTWGAAYIG